MKHSAHSLSSPLSHTWLDDAQALLAAALLVALAVVFFREAGLVTGGTAGLALLAHYATGWPFGGWYFVISLPFYAFAYLALGRAFTFKTFLAIGLLSLFAEWVPRWLSIGAVAPAYAAVMGGLLAGLGILILFRHRASLGGIGVVAVFAQQRWGWRAGYVQLAADMAILTLAFAFVTGWQALLSILGAVTLNLVIALNHRPGRYHGT